VPTERRPDAGPDRNGSIDWTDERVRLAECARENITQLNEVQPHGAILAVDPTDGTVRHLSLSAPDLLGAPDLRVGRRLDELIGHRWAETIGAAVAMVEVGGSIDLTVEVGDGRLDVTVTGRVAGSAEVAVLVEIEPAPREGTSPFHALRQALDRVTGASTRAELHEVAVQTVHELSGFERTMLYLFHPDGHGEIVAERAADGLPPMLGLHFPASDIPVQARALYVHKTCRHTVDAEAAGSPLVPQVSAATGAPLDLGACDLRAVSLHHRTFMHNMGTRASLSLSVVVDRQLVGLVNCTSSRPVHLQRQVRRACEILASQLSGAWGGLSRAARLAEDLAATEVRARIIEGLAESDDLAVAMTTAEDRLTDLIPADGTVVQLGSLQSVPEDFVGPDGMRELVRFVASLPVDEPWCTDELATVDGPLAAALPGVAGVLVLPLGAEGFLAWLRRPVEQTVRWLGDQRPGNRPDPLSPRFSFDLWRETVTDRSLPWPDPDLLTAFAADLHAVHRRRAERASAELSWYDDLTGLPNRRMAVRELDHLLEEPRRGTTTVLFVDLDLFKSVNDNHGHHVGDTLLVEVGRRLTQATRAHDTVARLSGDEFVIICPGADRHGAEHIAERIVHAMRFPFVIDDRELTVTVSIGIVDTQGDGRTTDVLRAADAAMYRAKREGRDRYASTDPEGPPAG
jgi:two-component system, chemotaxis family, sensor kinase Cph1